MTDDIHDCVIIGQGLAGTTLAWQLLWRGCRVLILDRADTDSASRVAAGLMTPVTGQRVVPAWRLPEFWLAAVSFYHKIAAETGRKLLLEPGQVRIFASELEQQRFQKRDSAEVADWVCDPAPPLDPKHFRCEHGGFELPRAARLDVAAFLKASRKYFQRLDIYRQAGIDPVRDIKVTSEVVQFPQHSIRSRRVVFCQGFAGSGNPLFEQVRFDATRGEILTLRIPGLTETRIVNRGVWLAPLENGLFLAGATYDWKKLDAEPTESGREELCSRLREFLLLPFEVVGHSAGVRPIVVGRHPIVGVSPDCPRLGIFNGLGSKGSLQAPLLAARLADLLLDGIPVDEEVDVAVRFPVTTRADEVRRGPRLTDLAHEIVGTVVGPGDTAIDATAGNGHDTCFLSRLVGAEGIVFAVDCQAIAIERTRRRLELNELTNVTLHQCSHAQIAEVIPRSHYGSIAAVMFNLGYLPGGDKSVISRADSTVAAIRTALLLIRTGGVVTVLAYAGHPGGGTESVAVESLWESLSSAEFDIHEETIEGVEAAPRLFVARRLAPNSQAN